MIKKIWTLIEKIVSFCIYKVLKLNLSDKRFECLIQFVQFGLVGILNNLISYGTYLLLVLMGVRYVPANIIGFSVSVFNSYYWNNKYVFASEEARIWWITLLKTYISYAGTGIILSNALLVLWIEVLGISTAIAPLINLLITIPINFIVNKLWAYKR